MTSVSNRCGALLPQPYLTIHDDGSFVLTVEYDALQVCATGPHLHVHLGRFGSGDLYQLARRIEGLARAHEIRGAATPA